MSVAKSLVAGHILEDQLFPYPQLREKDQEVLRMMVDAIDQFLGPKHTDFKRWARGGSQPAEFIQGLRDLGLFGLIIPEEHGGLGLSNAGYARVLSQSSSHDSSVSLTIGAHSSIGMKGILLFGTPEQRTRYLPKLASGEMIAAFCLTESAAGSDAASIRTQAAKNPDGTWTLNGEKIWITNGGIADLYTVFARTSSAAGKITAFVVEAAWPGVSHGQHEDKMGIRASSTTTVNFADVQVPAENVLDVEGKGFKVAMAILNNGRTGLGGGAVGGMKALIALSSAQAQGRKQFNQPIAEFGLIHEKISQMTLDCFAAESVVWMVAHYIDSGNNDYSVEAAISKVFASEAMQRSAYEALQIAAGSGFMREYPYEQITRDCRILTIFEGNNEVLRLYIALSGLKDLGKSLGELQAAVEDIFNNSIKGFGLLTDYAEKLLTQATVVGRDKILTPLPQPLRESAEIYERYTVEFAKASDHLLRKHGKAIADRQHDLKRIADIGIDLFVGLCVLSRAAALCKTPGEQGVQAIGMARVFAQQAKRRMANIVRRITRNEDEEMNRLAGFILDKGSYPWDVVNVSIEHRPTAELQMPARRNLWVVTVIAVVAVALIVALAVRLTQALGVKNTSNRNPIPTVSVTEVGISSVPTTVSIIGTIGARYDMPIGVEGDAGQVAAIYVEAGDHVKRGQVLARLNVSVLEPQVANLEAALEESRADADLAGAEYHRAEAVGASGALSVEETQRRKSAAVTAEAKVKVAAALLAEAQARLARTAVRAPADGIILTRNVEVGQTATPGGEALFRLSEKGEVELRGQVAEQDLPLLKIGQSVDVRLTGTDRIYAGHVRLLGAVIDPQTRLGQARVTLTPDPNLRPGAFARAEVTVS